MCPEAFLSPHCAALSYHVYSICLKSLSQVSPPPTTPNDNHTTHRTPDDETLPNPPCDPYPETETYVKRVLRFYREYREGGSP